MGLLSAEELKQLLPAETSAFPSPIPTQSVSSDEFMPAPQTAKQREFEARIKEYGSELARHQGMSRRAFFKTAAGMAAAFVAMNETYGPLYEVSRAEAAIPEMAGERAQGLSKSVRHGYAHALSARRHAHHELRAPARSRGQSRLEPGAGGQAANHRGSQVRQLFQGSVPRQRHQGRLHQRLAVRRAAGLVSHQPDEVRRAREGQQESRHEAHVLARDYDAGMARLARQGRRGNGEAQARFVQGLHDRRQHQQASGQASLPPG